MYSTYTKKHIHLNDDVHNIHKSLNMATPRKLTFFVVGVVSLFYLNTEHFF